MRKLIFGLLAILMMVPLYGEAAGNKQLEKARKKELKEKLKEYKKGDWELLGSHTMEVALAEHYDKLANLEDGYEVSGIATKVKSKNVGKQMAANNAVTDYAQNALSQVQGRLVSDMAGSGVDPDAEFENFYAAYERLVEKEIRGELQPSYTIIKPLGDGTYEVRAFYIVSENAASKARLRAMENAFKESAAAQKYGEKISEYVKAGFDD